jgi:hypothetical protein
LTTYGQWTDHLDQLLRWPGVRLILGPEKFAVLERLALAADGVGFLREFVPSYLDGLYDRTVFTRLPPDGERMAIRSFDDLRGLAVL